MQNTFAIKTQRRTQDRGLTNACITCRSFTSDIIQASDGIMRNYSNSGGYIETSRKFSLGTVLVVRMTRCPGMGSSFAAEEGLRTIGLAQVKWMQELADKNTARYGMGIEYFE